MKKSRIALLDSSKVRDGNKSVAVISTESKQKLARQVSPAISHIIQEVQRELCLIHGESVDNIPTGDVKILVDAVSERLGFELSSFERDQVLAHIERDKQPFGILQDLVDDTSVTDIIVSSFSKIAVQSSRKNNATQRVFASQETYEAFVEKLLVKAGSSYSTRKPIADGMIGSFARIHAVHKSISDGGPYLTIRLNRFSHVTLNDIYNTKMAPSLVVDYLRTMVSAGQTVLIVGEVGTGKTTLTRALAATIPTHESILVIEDTPEIQLEHPHVRYIRTRESNTEGSGKISPSEVIRGGMRMAMNRIVFGEMRDAEAAESFIDVCASGHSGLSTLHARSAYDAITRLKLFLGRIQRGVDHSVLEQQIATAVQVVVYLDICKQTGKRRIMTVKEVGLLGEGRLTHRDMFSYQCENSKPAWKVLHKVSQFRELMQNASAAPDLASAPHVLGEND